MATRVRQAFGRWWLIGLVMCALVVAVGASLWDEERVGFDPSPPTPDGATEELALPGAWLASAGEAFGGEGGYTSVRNFFDGATKWRSGEVDDDTMRASLEVFGEWTDQTRAAVDDLPSSGDAWADGLIRAAALLYGQVPTLYRAALAQPVDSPVRTELLSSADRIRELADRVFDRARVRVEGPLPPEDMGGAIERRLPADVPDWEAEGLAPGALLGGDGDPVAVSIPERTAVGGTQSLEEWLRAIDNAGLPAVDRIRGLLLRGTLAQLNSATRELAAAVEALRDEPDPKGDPGSTAAASLSLLLQAESLHIAHLGQLVDYSSRESMSQTAINLAAAGDATWPPSAGDRSTGLAATSVLDAAP